MHKVRWLTVLLAGITLIGFASTLWAQEIDAPEATFVSKDGSSLTVYNNLAIVRDTRTFDLNPGLNRLVLTGVSPHIDLSSVIFSAADNAVILQQHFIPAETLDTDRLLTANIGATVTLTDRAGTVYEGELLSARDEILLRLEDSTILALRSDVITDYRFSVFPDNMITEPTLELIINNTGIAGEQQIVLTYLTFGITWTAMDYNMELAADNQGVDVTGWVTINNNTGTAFENAQITLAAGDFNRLQFVTNTDLMVNPTATAMAAIGTQPPNTGGLIAQEQQQPTGVTFDIDQPVTLGAYDARYVQFITNASTAARNIYLYDASPRIFGYTGFNTSPTYGVTGVTSVQNFLEFSTSVENGLGTALPAGRLRTYRSNERNNPTLIGDTTLPYTPEDKIIRIFLEDTPGIIGERRQIEFQLLSDDVIQESYEIRLSNRTTDEQIQVVVPERMTRSSLWEILSSSLPYEQPDQVQIVFTVDVPPGEDVVITYTVLYTRPQ